jgi:hypothetical protein
MIIDKEKHIKNILVSYLNLTGLSILPQLLNPKSLVQYFDQVNFVLLTHGIESDPILNYGNKKAMELWEMTPEEFLKTPSRKTAEAPLREEREQLLQKVNKFGFINDYHGIRISKSGKRFEIKQATIWNVADDNGNKIGQAAMFYNYTYL